MSSISAFNQFDLDAMIASLDVCLTLIDNKQAKLTASDIRLKSMLSALRAELHATRSRVWANLPSSPTN